LTTRHCSECRVDLERLVEGSKCFTGLLQETFAKKTFCSARTAGGAIAAPNVLLQEREGKAPDIWRDTVISMLSAYLLKNPKEKGGVVMGLLKDDVSHLRRDLEHMHNDIEHLTKDLENCGCNSSMLQDLKDHVNDLDSHVHDVLAHVLHVEEHEKQE
jgi:hypothetical protein